MMDAMDYESAFTHEREMRAQEKHRRVMALRHAGMSQKKIAARLGVTNHRAGVALGECNYTNLRDHPAFELWALVRVAWTIHYLGHNADTVALIA